MYEEIIKKLDKDIVEFKEYEHELYIECGVPSLSKSFRLGWNLCKREQCKDCSYN